MKWLSRNSNQDSTSSFDSGSEDSSSSDHLGAMASPNYCNNIACWCHTSVEYHDTVTSLPTDVTGDDAYRALGTVLDSDILYMW